MSSVASTGGGVSTGGASTGGASTGVYTGSTGGSTGASQSVWGDDWRDRIAGGNADERKRLDRFEGPEVIYKSFREYEKRQSAGELRSALKKDATADEQERWRKENGVPLKAEEYKVTLPEGGTAPKEDDAFLNAFRKAAHDNHYTQAQFDSAVSAFYQEVTRQGETVAAAEGELAKKTEDTLRADWGVDYRTNKAMAEQLLSRAPAGFRDRFMNGYLADHSPIKASPEAWKWLVQLEREINPAATVGLGAGGDPGKSLADELQSIRDRMRTDRAGYNKDEKMQARYRELLDVKDKVAARGG